MGLRTRFNNCISNSNINQLFCDTFKTNILLVKSIDKIFY
uniref:Uncharacterized protein n=1 Tax=Rhizophora mucronata TaxID=61149 RepID=A0A2P2PRG9_RHIMU